MNQLIIRISERRIILCTYDRLQNLLPQYESYQNDPTISLNANIHKVLKQSPLAQENYNFVDVYMLAPSTLVPLKEFEEDDINDIFFFNYPSLAETHRVFYDTLPYMNAVLLFAADKGMCHSLQEMYPAVKFHNILSPIILQFHSRYPFSSTSPRLYCYLNEQQLMALCIKEGVLNFMNSYIIHNPNDALYYTAALAQRLGLDPKAEKIYVAGDEPHATAYSLSLGRIGQRPFKMVDEEELSHHPISQIKEFPYDLKVLLLKAY